MIFLGEPDSARGQTISQILSRWPLRSFEQALPLYAELQCEPPRLLLLNLLLPGMDPFLMIRLLKFDSLFQAMPILCLTPYQEPGLPDRLHRLGARGWLHPDGEAELLREAVETLLGDRNGPEAAPDFCLELPGLVVRSATGEATDRALRTPGIRVPPVAGPPDLSGLSRNR